METVNDKSSQLWSQSSNEIKTSDPLNLYLRQISIAGKVATVLA